MSDKMRWRYGDTNPVVAEVISASVIEIGDLVYQDTDDAKPASAQADGGTEAANQETFALLFLGVAMQRSKSGETSPIRVATSGVFEFDCASQTWELGADVAIDEASSGTALEDQKVTPASSVSRAIGRVAKRVGTAATSVLVDIHSVVMRGSIAEQTASST